MSTVTRKERISAAVNTFFTGTVENSQAQVTSIHQLYKDVFSDLRVQYHRPPYGVATYFFLYAHWSLRSGRRAVANVRTKSLARHDRGET